MRAGSGCGAVPSLSGIDAMRATLAKLSAITAALLAAAYITVGSINISGLMSHDFTAADIVRQRCPVHLIQPGWLAGTDQFDVLFRWSVAEMRARLAVLMLLWILAVSAIM